MRLVPRLLLLGVALPVLGILGGASLAHYLFAQTLAQNLDDRLLAQAAAESVSLFDGFGSQPHFHAPNSMLAADVAPLGTQLGLLAPDGSVFLSSQKNTELWRQIGPKPKNSGPTFTTVGDNRILSVSANGDREQPYTLLLAAPLGPVRETMTFFRETLGLAIGAFTLLLIGVLYWQARLLVERLRRLGEYLPRIKQATEPLPVSLSPGDELSELEVALHDTAVSLRQQSQGQENFLANAAHQLRTPLSVLRTEIDVALRKPRSIEELRATLEAAKRESDRLAELARRLLDFESLRSFELETTSVVPNDLAKEAIDRCRAGAKGRQIDFTGTTSTDFEFCCDATLVIQAVENLIDNALRFSTAQVEVLVSAGADGFDIVVRDRGVGISDADKESIFEPFYRGKNAEAQTGLGLAFVADVARRHGGRAFYRRPEDGIGSSIGISIPHPLPAPSWSPDPTG